MKRKPRKDAVETRQRLLAAAAEVFAEKGFWEATHAEICRKAGANTAAVNYHFTSKENLYVEAWRHAFERSVQAHPPDGGVPSDAPAQERVHGKILALMHRMGDPTNFEVEIVHKEMANPTGLLAEAMRRTIEPMRLAMRTIVQELLGDAASEQSVVFCEMSLMGQCFGPILHMRRARLSPDAPRPVGPPIEFDVRQLAEHITQFTLAGIRGIRESTARAPRAGKKQRKKPRASKRE
jgi:AcrR family transcriptional regulator